MDPSSTDNLRQFLVNEISSLVAIPSPSGREKGVADYVFSRLKEAGLSPQRDNDDNVWAETGSGRKRLQVNAHMDTVVPVGSWTTDPYKAKLDGDLLHGLGSSDCKAGIASMLWLVSRAKPAVRVLWTFTVCEEGMDLPKPNGSVRMAAMGGDWVVACEPTCEGESPMLGIGTQGHARASVTFKGKAAHSSLPEDGENAVYAAARFCAALERLNASFKESVIAPGAVARASVAPTIVNGGTLVNIIPDECRVMVSRRLAPGETVRTLEEELAGLLKDEKASWTISNDGAGAVTRMDGALLCAARRASAAVGGGERLVFSRGRTDAVIYSAAGMDSLTVGPGQMGQCHVAGEYVDLRGAVKCTNLLENLINGLPDR